MDAFGTPIPRQISIEILTVFKGDNLLNATIGDTIKIDIQNPWQHNLTDPGDYLLSGYVFHGRKLISVCNWYKRWQDITFVQGWGLKKYYELNCQCMVTFCPVGEVCQKNDIGCEWSVTSHDVGVRKSDCTSRMSVCLHDKTNKKCSWYTAPLLCKNAP